MLIALEETENALVAYRQAQLRLHQLTEAEKAQQRAVVLAHDRYRSGLVDFLDVLEAERSLYTSQAHLAQGERAVSQNLVRLYKGAGRWLDTGVNGRALTTVQRVTIAIPRPLERE